MDIKHITCDIRTGKKHIFLDIPSTNINKLVPSLYQCVKTHSIEVFWLLSQPLPHLVGHNLRLSNVLEFLDPVVNCFTRQTLPNVNREHLFMNILYIEFFCPQKRTTERCTSVVHSSSTFAILTTEISLWTYACASTTYTAMKLDCAAT
jgi:hypothetical protein